MTNFSMVTEFLLRGFSDVWELQLVHAVLFLLVYLATLTGNLLIITVTTLDRHLHTPMYFFLKNLSILDLCLISTTVPKSVHNSLTDNSSISFLGCAAQLLLWVLFASSEIFVLTAMSYDRYAAICYPLRYEVMMSRGVCVKMVAASWLIGSVFGFMLSASTFSLPFYGSNAVPQFFCDVPSLLQISCSEDHSAIDVSVTAGVALAVICFIYITLSYVRIFSAVLRMPSTEGRAKAFSTCLPHLMVVTLFIGNGAFAYLKPPSDSPSVLDLLVSMLYTMVPPALNPLIYSLRNRDMKAALRRTLKGRLLRSPFWFDKVSRQQPNSYMDLMSTGTQEPCVLDFVSYVTMEQIEKEPSPPPAPLGAPCPAVANSTPCKTVDKDGSRAKNSAELG
ncbi:olfactory receptor 14A2-like [Tachyglossus aculeatus]|uniref:olfactory receptor 14A2-like n=1 Tax=Tachyglossus aculeatus TaxID=9261 RepID=UPI0018F349D8|nr:olfactory receptor 14A2-like [Tachyglossus aculeatus]